MTANVGWKIGFTPEPRHPSLFYIGIVPEKYVTQAGEKWNQRPWSLVGRLVGWLDEQINGKVFSLLHMVLVNVCQTLALHYIEGRWRGGSLTFDSDLGTGPITAGSGRVKNCVRNSKQKHKVFRNQTDKLACKVRMGAIQYHWQHMSFGYFGEWPVNEVFSTVSNCAKYTYASFSYLVYRSKTNQNRMEPVWATSK